MLYTLHCFCWVTPRAMRQTGMWVSQQDAEDYVYFWDVVGRLMGIEPSLLPATPDEAERSFEVIKAAGRGASADGKALTRSAMRVMARMIRQKTLLGRWDMRITRAYMEDFLDDATLPAASQRPDRGLDACSLCEKLIESVACVRAPRIPEKPGPLTISGRFQRNRRIRFRPSA